MIDESDAYQNGSIRSDHTVVKMKEPGTTTSRAQPAASRESFAQVMENGRTDAMGMVTTSVSTMQSSIASLHLRASGPEKQALGLINDNINMIREWRFTDNI